VYRETRAKVEGRQGDGSVVVEMEAAALMAIAHFRRVPLAYLLYAGDSLAGPEWEHRGFRTQSVREALFFLAAETCFRL